MEFNTTEYNAMACIICGKNVSTENKMRGGFHKYGYKPLFEKDEQGPYCNHCFMIEWKSRQRCISCECKFTYKRWTTISIMYLNYYNWKCSECLY